MTTVKEIAHDCIKLKACIRFNRQKVRGRKILSEYTSWITREIKYLMQRREFLETKAVKTGSKQVHEALNKEQA